MTLLGQLLLTESVQYGELLVQPIEITVADGGQLDLDDRPSVWHHHGYTTEQDLQVLR